MRIYIQIQNTNTGEQMFTATAPDIDSAIAELGRYERIMVTASCMQCGEPLQDVNQFCNRDCAQNHQFEMDEDRYKEEEIF